MNWSYLPWHLDFPLTVSWVSFTYINDFPIPSLVHLTYKMIWHLYFLLLVSHPTPGLSHFLSPLATESVPCQVAGLISCLSWRRGKHVQGDQLLGRCQLWALGTVWHAESGYTSGDPVRAPSYTDVSMRASEHNTHMHTLMPVLPSALYIYGPQGNVM